LSAPVPYVPGSDPQIELPLIPESFLTPLRNFKIPELAVGEVLTADEIQAWLERLKLKTLSVPDRWRSDRSVSAILIDSENRILANAWNQNAVLKTRHAEMNLCAQLAALVPNGKIPLGSRLYVSLKPCRMCAARIWEMAEDPTKISVIYLENDPGPRAQGTLLDPNSPARIRYLGPNSQRLGIEIQQKFRVDG
jgi:tRNA(Arg) A34 adenosine deaminase TadA